MEPLQQEHGSDLVDELLARLEVKGAPAGMWLVAIEEALADVENVARILRRMRDALIRRGDD